MGTSGANKISCSWGYCESHDRSAPRSTIPMPTWKRVPPLPWAAAYWSATSWSRVVDMKLDHAPADVVRVRIPKLTRQDAHHTTVTGCRRCEFGELTWVRVWARGEGEGEG